MKKVIGSKNIEANIYRVQATNSVMCGYILKMYEKRSINYCNIDLYLIKRAQ